jgi:cytochrome oxidase Cu insertion factor (SCO1/SenC/PrrC family)
MAIDGIYLIDPLGNIMMYYAADADPNHIRQDLKRLLTWSKLDEQ